MAPSLLHAPSLVSDWEEAEELEMSQPFTSFVASGPETTTPAATASSEDEDDTSPAGSHRFEYVSLVS